MQPSRTRAPTRAYQVELKRADGSVVLANRPPAWETPTKGDRVTGPTPEALDGGAVDNATTFREEGRKYQYNWGTPKAGQGYYHRVGVRLDDGQTYHVNIGLK